MSIRHGFVSGKSDTTDGTAIQPSHWNADHVGSTDWDVVVTKTVDDTVTGNASPVVDSQLVLSVGAGEIWRVELVILYAANSATSDYRFQLGVNGGQMAGWYRYIAELGGTDAIAVSTGVKVLAATTTSVQLGGDTTGTTRSMLVEATLRFTASATFSYRFSQWSSSSSFWAKTLSGSILRAVKIL